MKKLLSILVLFACLVALVACDTKNEGQETSPIPDDTEPYFVGKIVEIFEEEDRCLVEVTDTGNGHLVLGDSVLVNTNLADCPTYAKGDHIRVTFDGKVALSLPAQILSVSHIHITDSSGNPIK